MEGIVHEKRWKDVCMLQDTYMKRMHSRISELQTVEHLNLLGLSKKLFFMRGPLTHNPYFLDNVG